jgi:1,4-dihydroxy-6-naphthoate synthase
MRMTKRVITVAHSPDSDDAFMFYALATGKVSSPEFEFRHCLKDIETLNREAHQGTWDVTAISFHAYPYICDRYVLMSCGASLGDGYGPMVISQRAMTLEQLKGKRVAVPGTLTTAYLAMKIILPDFEPVVVPFDQIMDTVEQGSVDAGLIIHEGQLTFRRQGLHLVVDLGRWWKEQFDLPMPLGGNAIRREWDRPFREQINAMLRQSIQHALDHRTEAMSYALGFARDMEPELADRFVGMYVNGYTLDYGEKGRRAIETLFELGFRNGLLPNKPVVEF